MRKIKISDEDKHSICRLLSEGVPNKEIARRYNISQQYVSCIRTGLKFPEISSKYKFPKSKVAGKKRMTEEDAHSVCIMLMNGYTMKEIMNVLSVSKSQIDNIKRGNTFIHVSSQYPLHEVGRKVLDDDTVKGICELINKDVPSKEIAIQFNVSLSTISGIRTKRSHTNISDNYNMKLKKVKYEEATIRKVCELLSEGYRNCEIKKMVDIPTYMISTIRNRVCCKEISKDYEFPEVKKHREKETVIRKACEMIFEGFSNKVISMATGLCPSAVSQIRMGKKYKDISSDYGIPLKND